jgi:hypothetical protein
VTISNHMSTRTFAYPHLSKEEGSPCDAHQDGVVKEEWAMHEAETIHSICSI